MRATAEKTNEFMEEIAFILNNAMKFDRTIRAPRKEIKDV